MVNEFLFDGTMVNGLNNANICLIPKKEKPNEMSQFRPINLRNVRYKIISKVLCQRLKKILPDRISETQSAFVAGRQITYNVLIAQEIFHALRTNSGGRDKRMAIKTDMSKVYDRLEWEFISAVMKKMGFSETWIEWIMCIIGEIPCLIQWSTKRKHDPTTRFATRRSFVSFHIHLMHISAR